MGVGTTGGNEWIEKLTLTDAADLRDTVRAATGAMLPRPASCSREHGRLG